LISLLGFDQPFLSPINTIKRLLFIYAVFWEK
jgi:hypothetical protein